MAILLAATLAFCDTESGGRGGSQVAVAPEPAASAGAQVREKNFYRRYVIAKPDAATVEDESLNDRLLKGRVVRRIGRQPEPVTIGGRQDYWYYVLGSSGCMGESRQYRAWIFGAFLEDFAGDWTVWIVARVLVRRLFEVAGFTVAQASSVFEALEILKERSFDMIVTD